MVGWFRLIPVLLGTVLAAMGLLRIAAGQRVTWRVRQGHWATRTVVGLVLVTVALNAQHSSEHLFVDRDPAVYLTTGQWLADHGTLLIDARVGPFERSSRLQFVSSGLYDVRSDGLLHPQFLHLLPTLLGAASWLGGPWLMFRLNALLGGLALLTVFTFARRLTPTWFAAGATAALAVNLAQIHFSRDAYTEILTQVFVFAGLWFLVRARSALNSGEALIGGLSFGGATMTRVDGFLYLIPLGLFLVYEFFRSRRLGEPEVGPKFLAPAAIGAELTATIALLDLVFFSPGYLQELRVEVTLMFFGVAAVGFLLAFGMLFTLRPTCTSRRQGKHRARDEVAEWLASHRGAFAWAAALMLVAVAIFAYFLRPLIQQALYHRELATVALVQERAGVEIEPFRLYSEMSLRWIGWYIGVPALTLGIVGWALALRDSLLGWGRRLLLFLIAFSFVTAVYVWRPSITPDQIWAMRRFLPITIPGLLLLAFWLVARLWYASLPRTPKWSSRTLAVALAGLLLVVPATVSAPLLASTTQKGFYGATRQVCEFLPQDSAVVVRGLMLPRISHTLRSFCGVPVAILPRGESALVGELAERWENQGGRLYLMAEEGHTAGCGDPDPDFVLDFEYQFPERRLLGAPTSLEAIPFAASLTRVPAGGFSPLSATKADGLFFDGVDDYVEVRNGEALNVETVAVEIVFATASEPHDLSSILVTKGAYAGGWWMEYRPNGSLEFWVEIPGGFVPAVIPAGLINEGRLHRIVGVYDGRHVGVYCDGSLIDSYAARGRIVSTDHPLSIGRGFGASFGKHFFHGFVDEMKVWELPLASPGSDRPELPGDGASLVGHWSFDGFGTRALDLSEQANPGLLVGPARLSVVGGLTNSGAGAD
jgi:hypothetical protein